MNNHLRILLTGATGFVGGALLKKLPNVVVLGRSCPANFTGQYFKHELTADTDYAESLKVVDVVIHCAARVHIMNELVKCPLKAFRDVNVDATLKLARQAAEAGVRRFIFISSVKVNGESTTGLPPFKSSDVEKPEDPYGISKGEAEFALKELCKNTGMELVIIRPPLVYGRGVKANFFNLLKLSNTWLPLPFGGVNNKRSMIYLGNLVDFIICCVDHPKAANQTFLISDGEDLSLKGLIRYTRQTMGKPIWLLPVPVGLFKWLGKLTGKSTVIDRLVGDLQVDSRKAQELLEWSPPYSVQQGISDTVADFNNRVN